MASVNWPTILVGSVLTAILTILGQLAIQRYQHRLTKEMAEWTTRRQRADKVEQAVNHVHMGLLFALSDYKRKEYRPQQMVAPLLELRQALDEVGSVHSHPGLTSILVEFWASAIKVLDDMEANKSVDEDSDVWEDAFECYKLALDVLKQYRTGLD